MEDRGKCRKRPDLQYYKPPKMVNKSTNREEELPVTDKMEERSFHESSTYSDSGSGGGRSSVDARNRSNHHNKKPDKPVYIPRGKSNTIPAGGSSSDNNQRKRSENSGKYSKDSIDGDDGSRKRYERGDGSSGHHHHAHYHSSRKNLDLSPSIRQSDTISPLVFENSRYHRNRSEHDKDQRSRYHGDVHQNNTFPRGGKTMFPHDSKKKTPEEFNDRNYPQDQSNPNVSAASAPVESNQGSQIKPVCSAAHPYPESLPSSNKALNCPDRPSISHSHSSSHHSIKPNSPSSSMIHHQTPHLPTPVTSYPYQTTHQQQQHQQPYQNHQTYNHQPTTPNRQYLDRPQGNETKSESHGEAPSHRPQWINHDPSSPGGSQSGYGNNPRSRNKKFNRVDHKTFEQNLPPRLQRKLLMEKANMNRACQQHQPLSEHGHQSNPNHHHQEYNITTASNRGGIIRLPQDSSMNIPQYYNPSPSQRHVNQRNDSQHEYGPNMDMIYGNFHGDPKNWTNPNQPNSPNIFARQLYDPYGTSKPTVMIRPTAHTPYQSNDHPRCLILPGMIPVPVTATTDHTINQIASNAMVNSAVNDLPDMKTWQGSVNQQQPENNRLLPTSPPNVLVHYLPNYSSPPHLNHHHHQTDQVQSNQVSANHQPFDSTPAYSRRKLVEKNMTEIINLENELQSCLLKYPSHDGRAVNTLRWKIQRRYESIIVADPKFCAEHNVELSLWKSVFYQFIEMRRREIEENPKAETSKDELLKLVEESIMFFENLLVMLQDAFDFSVDKYIDHQYDLDKPGYEMIKLAAISAQKLYLYLGDLARYKEQAAGGSNYSKAKSYYTKAQQIAPKNGRPYNQLALLAMYGRRRLDAVYNYMRSLAASNPFQSARESLLSIFEEVRKKYEAAESKRVSEKLGALKFSDSTSPQDEDFLVNNIYGERLEIWIRPDGTSSKHTSVMGNESEEEELDLLTDIDLNKRFVLSFLHVHGKLFTKIGLESFNSAVNLMLLEFRCLLKRSPFPMSSQRLLQLMAISMFSVYQVSIKDGIYQPVHRSSLQEQAIQVILAMVSLLLEKADKSLRDHLTKGNSANIVSDDVAEILPAIKVWTDWMSCQKQFWSPPLSKPGFRIGARGDIWSLFAEVLTRLGDINTRAIKLLPTKFEGCEQVILPEDNLLSGFIPLLGAPSALSYVQSPFDKEKARTCLRVSRIQFFGDYLCGIPEPYLEFDVGKKRFHSSVTTSYTDENSEGGHNINLDLDDDLEDIPTDSSSGENLNIEDDDKKLDDPVLNELWSRQESLRQAQRREEKIRMQLDAMLREEKRRRLVIQPRFLLPDTNCFIHHLNKLQTLINCGHFEIIVPLIVINELHGLMSRVQQPNSSSPLPPSIVCEGSGAEDHEHEKRVGQSAEDAFQYLEKAFAEKNNKLRAITSKGSILNSMSFRNESLKAKRTNNDDLVLSCCLQFIKKRSSAKQSNPEDSDGIVNIFRETVLLTDDRNLRVKALSHNVPVKSLPVFLQFANLQ